MSERLRVTPREAAPQRCTYCLDDLRDDALWRCDACGAGKHSACQEESPGCGIPGCANAPRPVVHGELEAPARAEPGVILGTIATTGYLIGAILTFASSLSAIVALFYALSEARGAWLRGQPLLALGVVFAGFAAAALCAGVAWLSDRFTKRCERTLGFEIGGPSG